MAGHHGKTTSLDPARHEDSEESGVGHEEDEEMQQLLLELLSNMRTPKVHVQFWEKKSKMDSAVQPFPVYWTGKPFFANTFPLYLFLKVSEILARSALLQWGPPLREGEGTKFDSLEPISESDFRYEVLLSDKGKDGKYRPIFNGQSVDCRLTDLRPCTEYHIRIHALMEALKGKR